MTILFRPFLNSFIAHKISNPIISNIVSSTLVFIIAIIGLSILTSNIAKAINTKFPSSINITLGLAFGFTKGFLISSLIFATILNLFGSTEDLSSKSGPEWLQESETYRPLSFGAYIILPFADSIFGEIKERYIPNDKDKEDRKDKNSNSNSNGSNTYKTDNLRYDGNGYNSMDNLIESTERVEGDKANKDNSSKNNSNKNNENNSIDIKKIKETGGYKKEQVQKLNHLIDMI